MIQTFFGSGLLSSPAALFASLVIGLAFGFVLERAGFGSSKRLAGIFYLRDMTVLKVMFTGVIAAMLGILYAAALGWIDLGQQVFLMPTKYGAQIAGGLLFGLGFVISGWCPGTAAVGTASGKIDGMVFLGGAVIGSVAFNETFGWVRPLYDLGAQSEPLFAFGLPTTVFALLFTAIAIGAFYFAEWVEQASTGRSVYLKSPMLKSMSVALLLLAAALFIFPSTGDDVAAAGSSAQSRQLLASIEEGEDHVEPEELAARLSQGEPDLMLVDIRPANEYEAFHIRGAVNVPLGELTDYLKPHRNRGAIVLYSTGMTHPAQARDALAQQGFSNAYLLTDGLRGFVDRCLKPVSLRDEPLSPAQAAQVRAWRAFFLNEPSAPPPAAPKPGSVASGPSSGFVSAEWLAENRSKPSVRVLDVRSGPEYSTAHIPGSLRIGVESLRGTIGGVHSMLMPPELIAAQLSLLGLTPEQHVILVAGEKFRDATYVGLALDRVGHGRWSILEGGYEAWIAGNRPIEASLADVLATTYAPRSPASEFAVNYELVRARVGDNQTVVLDTRPADYFAGGKSDEARPGHIPGAVNRPYSEDLDEQGQLKPATELAAAYEKLVPDKETPIIVHCRTGHQASQTYFVLKHLLGYPNVFWYDGSWTEWAAHPELPAETG